MADLLRVWREMEPIDGVRAEYLYGEIVMMTTPKTYHNRIVRLLDRQMPEGRFEVWQNQAVTVPALDSEPVPDLMLTWADHDPGFVNSVDPAHVAAVFEIVSPEARKSRTGVVRDLEDKPELYAAAGIPLYVIVNPNGEGWIDVLDDPDPVRQRYLGRHRHWFGDRVPLPEPVGVTVDTSRFVRYPADG